MARELYITEENKQLYTKEDGTEKTITTENTVTVGYDFKNSTYYIINKDYTTERTIADEVLNTIRAIAPSITHITSPLLSIDKDTTELPLSYIQALSTTYEGIKKDSEGHIIYIPPIYYTWADNGSYIASIQISTYADSCLILNAEKSKLYIQNSNVIFDLSLNEDDRIRVKRIQQYYYNTVGLDLPYYFVGCLYTTMLSYYNPFTYNSNYNTFIGIPTDKPFPYNVIDSTTIPDTITEDNLKDIRYSNLYALADFTKKAPLEYACAENPNKVVLKHNPLNTISSLEENRITLTNPPDATIQVGSTFHLSHTTTVIDTSTYTSDGDYTITEIDTTNNILYTDKDFPYNYTYNPPILAIRGYEMDITSINRGTREITIKQVKDKIIDNVQTYKPNPLIDLYEVGDTIQIYGTIVTGSYGETITDDGAYTISSIGIDAEGNENPNIIIVEEPFNTNIQEKKDETTKELLSVGTIYKDVKAGDIREVNTQTSTITLQDLTLEPTYLTDGTNYAIIYTEGDEELRVRVTQEGNYNSETSTLQYTNISSPLKDITYTYAELNAIIYSEETQINILNSTDETKLPTGEFMVDTRAEVVNYLKLLKDGDKAIPTDTKTFNNIYKPVISNVIYFNYEGNEVQMTFKGIYSKVFGEDK